MQRFGDLYVGGRWPGRCLVRPCFTLPRIFSSQPETHYSAGVVGFLYNGIKELANTLKGVENTINPNTHYKNPWQLQSIGPAVF